MIVIWSDTTRSNPWVNQEIGAAFYKGMPILPLIQEGIPLEGMLEGLEGVAYNPRHPEDGIKKLVASLQKWLEEDGYQLLDLKEVD